MTIGVCRVQLRLTANHSLKGKRQIVKSLTARLHNTFNISAAEIGDNDRWQSAAIGIACVANSAAHVNEVLSNAVHFIETTRPDTELVDYEIEIVHAL
jgi:uncharacterized protein